MGAVFSSIIRIPLQIIRRIILLNDLRKLKLIKLNALNEHLFQEQMKTGKQSQLITENDDQQHPNRYEMTKQTPRYNRRLLKYWSALRQLFTINLFKFLWTLMKEDSKERYICEHFLMFWLGIVYTLLYFYIQVFVFEKFQTLTLFLVAVMALTTIILPQFSRWTKSFALILIPRSVMIVLRGAILSVIAFQIQTVTRMNIQRNYKSLVASLQCNVRKTERFTSESLSFGFLNTEGRKSFRFNFINPIKPFIDDLRYYAQSINNLVKSMTGALYHLDTLASNVAYYLRYTPFGLLVRGIQSLVKKVAEPVRKLLKSLIDQLKAQIRSWFAIKYSHNYNFYWISTNRNMTLRSLISDSFHELGQRHSYFGHMVNFIEKLVHFYVFSIFILIFFPPLLYMFKFKRNRQFDNHYITDKLIAYDEEMVQNERAINDHSLLARSLFPLRFVERFMFVRRTDPTLTIQELKSALLSFVVDFALLFYVLTFVAIDFIMLELVILFTKIYEFFYELALPDRFPDFLQFLNSSDGGIIRADIFIEDYHMFREDIRNCLPVVSPIDWQPYRKCIIYFCLLMFWKFVRPYINRTRGVICSRLYPQVIHKRIVYLYNHIWFQRMIMDASLAIITQDYSKAIAAAIRYIRRRMHVRQYEMNRNETWLMNAIFSPNYFCNKCNQQFERKEMIECMGLDCDQLLCGLCFKQAINNAQVHCEKCGTFYEQNSEEMSEVIDSSFEDF